MKGKIKMEKRYTLKEFEKKYDEAMNKAIKELMEEIEESDRENKLDSTGKFVFSMQNVMAFSKLKKVLFGEK